MFFRKKVKAIVWDFDNNINTGKFLVIKIDSIKPFKKTFFGVQNNPASVNFVPDAYQIEGSVEKNQGVSLNEKTIIALIPEAEVETLSPEDFVKLWLTNKHQICKLEKI